MIYLCVWLKAQEYSHVVFLALVPLSDALQHAQQPYKQIEKNIKFKIIIIQEQVGKKNRAEVTNTKHIYSIYIVSVK